jgi:hypothetical protein
MAGLDAGGAKTDIDVVEGIGAVYIGLSAA